MNNDHTLKYMAFNAIEKTVADIDDILAKNEYYGGNYYDTNYIEGLKFTINLLINNYKEAINYDKWSELNELNLLSNASILDIYEIRKFIEEVANGRFNNKGRLLSEEDLKQDHS